MASDYREITRWGKLPAWWLFHPDMNSDRLCLLAALTTYADERGLCCPSQSTIAKHLKRSRPWVNRVIAELVEVGLVEKRTRLRGNGGMTSCEYLIRFIPAEAPVTQEAAPCHRGDSPRHQPDRNQVVLEQNHNARRSARAADVEKSLPPENQELEPELDAAAEQKGGGPGPVSAEKPRGTVVPPRGWRPGADVLEEAQSLFPDGDVETHIALFTSKVRGKGYCIDPRRLDDTWLSWFIEDHRKAGRGHDDRKARPHTSAPKTSPAMHRFDRFSAWADVAYS